MMVQVSEQFIRQVRDTEFQNPRNLLSLSLKGLGHEIRIRFKWYGLMNLGLEKVRQIFIICLTVPLILNIIMIHTDDILQELMATSIKQAKTYS